MAGSVGTAYLTLVPKLDKGGLSSVEGQIKASGKKGGNGFADGFGNVMGKLAKAAAVIGGAQAVAGTFMEAFNAAADYEQLVGGVETLFGKSADTVKKYAEQAYQTSGLSANAYMEQATSFSASLISSLGGDQAKAAEVANMAIIDMSDNANKMGSSMESIQNAYNGFAKGNFTMLDNLKLGFGGTKEEMQRLLEEASKLSGQKYNIDSFADITEAIHVMQTEMHISGLTAEEAAAAVASGAMTEKEAFDAMGTTAKEASSTVSGSINQLQASWTNFLTGIGSGQEMGARTQELVSSFGTALENIIPLAIEIIGGLVDALPGAIEQLIPVVTDGIIKVINMLPTFIPALISSAINLFMGIVQAVPSVVGSLLGAIGSLLQQGWNYISSFNLAGAAMNMVQGMVSGIFNGAGAVVNAIRSVCSNALDAVKSFFGIHSPSTVMRKMFGYVGEGMALGLDDSERGVMGSMGNLLDGAYAMADGFSPSLYGAGGGALRGTNIYINNARVNNDDDISRMFSAFMLELKRKGAM